MNWKPVLGYEGRYEVSDTGLIRSIKRGIILKMMTQRKGYKTVSLYDSNGKAKTTKVHRAVLLSFVGPPPKGKTLACHNDSDVSNNNLSNLRWGSESDNMQDKIKHGNNHCVNKTHCPRGGELVSPNLAPWIKEARACLACDRTKARVKNHRVRNGIVYTDSQKQLIHDEYLKEILG